MSNVDKRPYRPDGGDIGTGRIKEIADNVYGDEEKCWLAKRVLTLLDDNDKLLREKDAMEATALALRDDMRLVSEKLEASEKRIAELEAREVKLPPTFWYEHDDLSRDIAVLDKCLVKKALREAGVKVAATAGKGE